MERRTNNLIFTSLIVAVTAAVACVGYVLVSGSPSPDASTIPSGEAQALADLDDSSLGGATAADPGADGDARPVLQVIDSAGGAGTVPSVSPGLEPNAEAATTLANATTSTAPPATAAPSPSTAPATPPSTSVAAATPTLAPAAPGEEWMTDVEREIVQLTNELRTNPNGPMRRQGPVIDCGGRIAVDQATGQYQPAPALIVDQVASVEVARPWAAQLTTDLVHRPQAGIEALQAAGVAVMTAGENIAYHNYSEKALRHFTGWRESDGHFCNMMDPGFTHIGIGEKTSSDGYSFATQNFFSLQPNG